MALIECPECGKSVSDQSAKCVNCGFPIENSAKSTSAVSSNDTTHWKHVGMGLCIIGGIIIGFTQQIAYALFGGFSPGLALATYPDQAKVVGFGILLLVLGAVALTKYFSDRRSG